MRRGGRVKHAMAEKSRAQQHRPTDRRQCFFLSSLDSLSHSLSLSLSVGNSVSSDSRHFRLLLVTPHHSSVSEGFSSHGRPRIHRLAFGGMRIFDVSVCQ